MSATLGNRWLPCRHHNARLPTEAGIYTRRCDTCKAQYTLTVTPAAYVSERCQQPVFIARWSLQIQQPASSPASPDGVNSGHKREGDRSLDNRPPKPDKEGLAPMPDLRGHRTRSVNPPAKARR